MCEGDFYGLFLYCLKASFKLDQSNAVYENQLAKQFTSMQAESFQAGQTVYELAEWMAASWLNGFIIKWKMAKRVTRKVKFSLQLPNENWKPSAIQLSEVRQSIQT